MSEAINKDLSPLEGGGQKATHLTGMKQAMSLSRPHPINTAVTKDTKKQPLTATTTASSNDFSPNLKTGSSIQLTPQFPTQFTPASSTYSPSIWSDGAGTPMSVASTADKTPFDDKTPKNNPFPSAQGPTRSIPETPSKSGTHNSHAAQGPAAPLPPHHVIAGAPGNRFGIAYYDGNGAFFPYKFPLTRTVSGQGIDATGQACMLPKAAKTFPIDILNEVTSGDDGGNPQGISFAKDGNVEETYTVVAKEYEVNGELVTPFIEVRAASVVSEITPHYTITRPDLAKQPKIFSEEGCNGNWKLQLNERNVVFEEAFAGAIDIVKSLNASHITMGHGDRVICIKTDYVNNIHWSVRRGVWAAMDKVGERINRLMESCQKGEKVWLLFSINAQKSYCGLGYLTGPWVEKSNAQLEGWMEREDGTKTMGVLPMTWTHIKNVPFEYFKDIVHSKSGQPIVNMWNGMHFPTDKGREVIQRYIQKPHFTNCLSWRGDRPYNPYKDITHPSQLDPRLKTSQNEMSIMKRDAEARKAAALAAYSGAKTGEEAQQPQGSTPSTIRDRRGVAGGNIDTAPPNLDGAASPSPLPGQRVSVSVDYIIDTDGNYIPVTPSHQHTTPVAMQKNSNNLMPPQQGLQQRAPSYTTRGRGGFVQGARGNLTGRGGKTGQLRGAASFINPGIMHLNQNGYGRGMPLQLHGAQSFDGGFHGFVQEFPVAPMAPAMHHMQSQVGMNGNFGIFANPNGGMGTMSFPPPMQRAQSAQYNTNVLRQAVSKPNHFVPSMMQAAPPQAGGQMAFTPGFNNVGYVNMMNDPFTTSTAAPTSTPESHQSVPPVEHTPSHLPGIVHDSNTALDTAKTTAIKKGTANSPESDGETLKGLKAQMKAKEKEMQFINKHMINMHGEWSTLNHQIRKAMKAKGMDVDSDDGSLPDTDNLPDYCDPDWWGPKCRMGSGTTFERQCVSPVCDSEGGILDSVSKHDSPETKARRREHNHRERYIWGQCDDLETNVSLEKRIVDNLEEIVSSPPTSEAGGEKKDGEEKEGGVSLE